MKYLIFDTETTGLIPKHNFIEHDYKDFPRIIELAFVLADENGDIIQTYRNLIKPNNWTVPNKKFWRDNGFTNKENLDKGVDIKYAINEFSNTLYKADALIGHNVVFDYKILASEYMRLFGNYELLKSFEDRKICTMYESIQYCRIPKYNMNGYKRPKLQELYYELFNKKFDNAHSALDDALATKECFFKLKELKVI